MRLDNQLESRPILCIVNGQMIQGSDFHRRYEKDYTWVWSASPTIPELLEQLDKQNPDCAIVFLDSVMEDHDWIEFIEYCELRYIPCLTIASREDQQIRNSVIGDALFHFPDDMPHLDLHIQKHIARRQRIMDQILIDPVTGAHNYRYLRREVEKQLNDMKRSHDLFSMVYMEVDRAEQGKRDYCTRSILAKGLASFIQGSIRPTDCLAHHQHGGFVLILPKTVKEDALKLMERLIGKFASVAFQTPDGPIHATFSAKVVEFVDANMPPNACLDVMAFTVHDPQERTGMLMNGTMENPETAVRKLKLAIIDDDRLIREMLKQQLSDIGGNMFDVEVKVFPDGEGFFQDPWHRQNERFLLIIDRIMPKMDGLEILQRIRAGYDRRRYLCFMLTSRNSESEIALAIQRGANDYMVKPFSIKELRARLKRLIGA